MNEWAELVRSGESYLACRQYDKALMCAERAYELNKGMTRDFLCDYREKVNSELVGSSSSAELWEMMFQSWLIESRDNFEAFMIAMEWDRTENARFWLPRRRILEDRFHLASKIQDAIDNPTKKKLCLSMPPGTGKSTLIKFLLTYIAGKYPNSMNMYVSYSDGMIKIMMDSVVTMATDLEYNFAKIFPRVGKPKISAEYNTVSFRGRGDFPTIGLVSMGGSVTGRTRANKFFITDDLVKNAEEARSPERLERLYNDYTDTLTTRMIGDDVTEIMLGTIWSLYDPISREKSKHEFDEGYEFVSLPVCDEDGHSNFRYDHPDAYSDEKIAEIREKLNPATFSCLYMQKGVEKEGLAFAKDRLQWYSGNLPMGEPDNVFFYADVAWGGVDSFSMPIAYQYGDDVYIHDVIFDRRDKSFTMPRVVGKIMQHKIKMGRFEANAGGSEYCDEITRMLKEEHKYSCNLTSKRASTHMSKMTRIEQHQDTIRRFYFRSDKERGQEYTSFLIELNTFSFTAKNLHDDAADSLAGLADYRFAGESKAYIYTRPF